MNLEKKILTLGIGCVVSLNLNAMGMTYDVVAVQDNVRVYYSQRPDLKKRLFVSNAVEEQIRQVKNLLKNKKLAFGCLKIVFLIH